MLNKSLTLKLYTNFVGTFRNYYSQIYIYRRYNSTFKSKFTKLYGFNFK